jgi:hypothetical protein
MGFGFDLRIMVATAMVIAAVPSNVIASLMRLPDENLHSELLPDQLLHLEALEALS